MFPREACYADIITLWFLELLNMFALRVFPCSADCAALRSDAPPARLRMQRAHTCAFPRVVPAGGHGSPRRGSARGHCPGLQIGRDGEAAVVLPGL